ncbi:MAG TPA: methyltransferase domain-containing protein [Streptomyces sp.]
MVRRIVAGGGLADPAWRAAFTEVPRHLFVPASGGSSRSRRAGPGSGSGSPDDPDPRRRLRWLAGAYADQPIATHVVGGELVSSSSQPSLMALMCEALEVTDGMRVLEVGAGTGYNAALLAHRLGPGAVTTIDLDEEITDAARAHLAAYGTPAALSVTVVTGDGAEGHPPGAPYDRIMATCELPSIPAPWLAQCVPGGRVLAPFATGLIDLTVYGPERAEGRFLSTPAFFVPLRGPAGRAPMLPPPDEAETVRDTGTPPRVVGNDLFRFLLTLVVGPLDIVWSPTTGDAHLMAADGSTARATTEGTVHLTGPRDLWSLAESAHTLFREYDHPARARFGLTVEGGRQSTWLDSPDGPHRWDMPL